MMSKKRHILIESFLVTAVLATGIMAASAANAGTLPIAMQAADARANVKIDSEILVERTEKNAAGQEVIKQYIPNEITVIPGDKLLFVNSYRNTGATPVTGFVVNNPVHGAVSFTSVDEDWALVSIDGGKSFGKLPDLMVAEKSSDAEGNAITVTRAAQPSDVTHVRWVFDKPIAASASGKLRFRGIVK